MVYRARASCPTCNFPDEVWLDKGKVCFTELTTCDRCGTMYDPLDYISLFNELRTNSTISSKFVQGQIRT